uniref:F-box domain-containing protein n=1 Tax=Mycena chlorophos TaxID=658473 RepID=A0ABQ0L758_MYCCL|nr:predicted protein [Mycena chlorophos]
MTTVTTAATLTQSYAFYPQHQLYHYHHYPQHNTTFVSTLKPAPPPVQAPQYLLRLPQELLDEILSELEHADLVAIALVSRACTALVVPRHTEYRVIRTRHLLPAMWAHLARRADLARNIREVHIAERSNRMASDRIPRTLLAQPDATVTVDESLRVRNMCVALGHMDRLHTFTWSWEVKPPALPTVEPGMETAVMQALKGKTALRHLGLAGLFGMHAPTRTADPESLGYPLWGFERLTRLVLRGDAWIRPANALHMRRLLERCRDIEYLELPLELAGTLAELKFPALTHLNLFLNSGGTRTLDTHVVRFLAAHPNLMYLSWTPIDQIYLAPNALPELRGLQTAFPVVAMLDGSTKLESLEIPLLDPSSLISLAESGLNAASVKRVRLDSFDRPDTLRHFAALFPNITWLAMPARYAAGFTLEDWLDILPRFQHLEVFRGQGLWGAVTLDLTRMHGVIMQLVQLCPKLRELDHYGYNTTRAEWNRVRIVREGSAVRYVVEKPPSRRWFDAFDGAFD